MLTPRVDGLIESQTPVRLPFMGPRLQGELAPDGRLDLAVWGTGEVGSARLTPFEGPLVYGPNSVVGRFHVAQSAPVVLVRGARLKSYRSSGCLLVAESPDHLRIAVGADRAEAERALAQPPQQIEAEAAAHAARCDVLPDADPVLRSMAIQGAHAALASVRADPAGRFAGLAAGLAYSSPARTYFRDAYWTTPMLLALAPELVAAEIDLLARGVQPDGEAPSGVVTLGLETWDARRDPQVHRRPGEWWSDHFDSPLFFALMVADYVRATGDAGPAERHRQLVDAIAARYRRIAGPDGLPLKPRHDRDWADNVFRSGHVAYDLGLWFGTLQAGMDEARAAIDAALWQEDAGWYADYRSLDGFTEPHLALDSLTLLRLGAAPEDKARRVLDACRRQLSRKWGTACVHPPYARRADLRAKSAFAGRYHNGGDWPWLDALYAAELLSRGLPGWRHPLTRWWETCLERGWLGAVEHFSPVFGRGSLLQGWSSFPAAVALEHRQAVLAGDPA